MFFNKKILLCIFSLLLVVCSICNPTYAGMVSPTIVRNVSNEMMESVGENSIKTEQISDERFDSIRLIDYYLFWEKVEKGDIEAVYFENNELRANTYIYFKTKSGLYFKTYNPDYETFKKHLLENKIKVLTVKDLKEEEYFKVYEEEIEEESGLNNEIIDENGDLNGSFVFMVVVFGIGLFLIYGIAKQNKNKVTVSGVSDGKIEGDKHVDFKTFNDIAGLKEVKKDVMCLVDFLKNGNKYEEMGAKLPKGVILYGPPGTGKTLLAKAIAGEAGVPFFFASGSDFIEMYVGVGPKRVRELFNTAKKSAPCIIFIDEIDAIGGKRSHSDNSEDRKTLNALLAEMDGFKTSKDILVIGATNRLEDLDPAIVRPGRFTDKFCVPLPESIDDRLEITNLYIKNKRLAEDVDLNRFAKETIGCSPADIESIINESAIIAVQEDKNFIDNECIEKAYNKRILKGHIKEDNKHRRKEELELVAWHEAGHTLAGILLGEEINKVTILSTTSGAGGVTFTVPKKMGLLSVEDLRNQVIQLYAGRCAEYLLYKDWRKTTTGASNDIDRATEIIYKMVSTYGMEGDVGLLNLNLMNVDSKVMLDKAIILSKELQEECLKLLEDNIDKLKIIVEGLLEKQTLYNKDLQELLNISQNIEENK